MRLEFTSLAGPRIDRQRAEQDERERYAQKHDRFTHDMDRALYRLGLMTGIAYWRKWSPTWPGISIEARFK